MENSIFGQVSKFLVHSYIWFDLCVCFIIIYFITGFLFLIVGSYYLLQLCTLSYNCAAVWCKLCVCVSPFMGVVQVGLQVQPYL